MPQELRRNESWSADVETDQCGSELRSYATATTLATMTVTIMAIATETNGGERVGDARNNHRVDDCAGIYLLCFKKDQT